jgi:hypothetical protein
MKPALTASTKSRNDRTSLASTVNRLTASPCLPNVDALERLAHATQQEARSWRVRSKRVRGSYASFLNQNHSLLCFDKGYLFSKPLILFSNSFDIVFPRLHLSISRGTGLSAQQFIMSACR